MSMKIYVLLLITVCFSAPCVGNNLVKENLNTFHEFKLKNNIPVVVKITKHSRIKSIVLAIDGGKGLVLPEKAGLDKLTLNLMASESEKYPDVARRAVLKKTSASIGTDDGLDFSRYHLKTIDTYFDEVFDLYADLFLNPVFPEKLFDELVTNLKNRYRADLADGYSRVSLALNSDFFAGHPYSAYLFNIETIENISLEEVKAFYKENYVAPRMALFAVGDFDVNSLKKMLEATFGNISQGTHLSSKAHGFEGSKGAPALLDPYVDLKKETSYVRANFEVIPVTHNDYWALLLASSIVSDIMSDLIRTKNSMVYSVWTNVFGKKSNYAGISAYRTNNPLKVMDLIAESIEIASSGRCISPYRGKDNPAEYVAISKGLDFYKTSFATRFYAGLQTNTSIAMKMADAYMLAGDYTRYLYVMGKIQAVSPGDVEKAVDKYIKSPVKHWAVTAHPDTIELIKASHKSYFSTYRMVNLR